MSDVILKPGFWRIAGRRIIEVDRLTNVTNRYEMITEDGLHWDVTLPLTGEPVVELQLRPEMEVRG